MIYICKAREAERYARVHRKPVFLHMKTVRLLGHAGSDMETSYHSLPRKSKRRSLTIHCCTRPASSLKTIWATAEEIVGIYKQTEERVAAIGEYCKTRPKYLEAEEVRRSLIACAHPRPTQSMPREQMQQLHGNDYTKLQAPLHLAKLINMALHETLARYPGAVVFGEDVAQKGGVYNVTDGLYSRNSGPAVFSTRFSMSKRFWVRRSDSRKTAFSRYRRFNFSPTSTMPRIRFVAKPQRWRFFHRDSLPTAW